MEHVERLAQIVAIHYKRNVCLRGTLCTCNHGDTATAERAEEFSGNTRCVFHVFTHDGYGGQTALCVHGEHGASLNLLGKLMVQYLYSSLGIGVLHTD